jgi:hypothetical protein
MFAKHAGNCIGVINPERGLFEWEVTEFGRGGGQVGHGHALTVEDAKVQAEKAFRGRCVRGLNGRR